MKTYLVTWKCHVCEQPHSFAHELADPDAWPNKWNDLTCQNPTCGSQQDVPSRTADKQELVAGEPNQLTSAAAAAPAAAPPSPAPASPVVASTARPAEPARPRPAMRFAIRIAPAMRLLMWPLGARRGNAFVELQGNRLRVSMGSLFGETFALETITAAREEKHWPWYRGLGWRTDFSGLVALVGSYEGIVCLELSPSQPVRLFVRSRCEKLYVSLEDPAGFLAMLAHEQRTAAASRAGGATPFR